MKLQTAKSIFGICCLAGVFHLAMAAEPNDTIIKNVAPLVGEKVESVTKTTYANLYELVTSRGIAYTDKTGSFVIFGSVVDTTSKENLTQKRVAEISRFNFSELPLTDAVTIVRGDGSRKIATFEDPNCAFCKKLAPELAKLNNVTIYTFIIPILGDDSVKKAKTIWCDPDHKAAWQNAMLGKISSNGPSTCDVTALDRNVELSKRLRVAGTPAIMFADGNRIPGFATIDALENKLAQLTAKQ